MHVSEGWRSALVLGATAVLILALGFVLNLPDQAGFLFLPVYWATYVVAGYLLHNRWALVVPALTVVLMTIPNYLGPARRFPDMDRLFLLRSVIRNTITGEGVVAAGLVALGVGLYVVARGRASRRGAPQRG